MAQRLGCSPLIRGGLIVAVSGLTALRAHSSCAGYVDFGQLTPACGGGSTYCYVLSPGFDTSSSIVSAFWSLHAGNAAVGSGTDNGSWQADGAWLLPGLLGSWLGGSWSGAPGIDGCIASQIPPGKSSEVMVASFSDADLFGTHGYFAAAAVSRHLPSTPQFDFAGGIGTDIELKPIPRPNIFRVDTGPAGWRFNISSPLPSDLAAGFYSDGSASAVETITGYRIYRKVANDGRPPTDRRRSSWTPVTPVVPLGQPAAFNYACSDGLITYYALTLVFDGGFETSYVSANSLPNEICLDCVDDLDGDGWSYGEICGFDDCNDDDPTTHPGAAEVNDGRDNGCPGDPGFGLVDEIADTAGFYHPGDTTRFTWLVQDGAAGYEVARSTVRDFSTSCLMLPSERPTLRDPVAPPPGGVFYYLVRSSLPHVGSWGRSTSGVERAIDCDSLR